MGKQQHQIQDGGQQEADEGKSHSLALARRGAASPDRDPYGGPRFLGATPFFIPRCVVPLCRARKDLTGPLRPQPGRERKAAPGAASAGPSDLLGQFSCPLLPERSPALRRSGRGPGRGRRLSVGRAWRPQAGRPRGRKPEPRLGVRAAEPPGSGPRSPFSEPHSASPQLRDRGGCEARDGKGRRRAGGQS